MPPHCAQALLRDALLHVPIEAFPRQVAQPVRADPLLAARAERHHVGLAQALAGVLVERPRHLRAHLRQDRKSTRLNSSHVSISYAVFCLKKKKTKQTNTNDTST